MIFIMLFYKLYYKYMFSQKLNNYLDIVKKIKNSS